MSNCRSNLHWEIERRNNRYKGVSTELNVELEKLYTKAKENPHEAGIVKVPDTELKVCSLSFCVDPYSV